MVPNIKKILFTTDLSENSRHAFYYAAAVATRHGADLIILHVMEELVPSIEQQLSTLFGEEKWKEMQEAHKLTARDILIGKKTDYDVVRKALAGFSTMVVSEEQEFDFSTQNVIVKTGNVVDGILAVAEDEACDLIVVGSHKGLLGRTAIGDVSKKVLQKAKVPVLVVPPPR